MPVSVSIEPFSPSLDMYDSPDTSSAYSLSGHIAITLTPSSSILGLSRSSPQNLLLTSLELTFEGQSELMLNEVGYAPLRLISITKELVSPAEPVHISADEDSAEWRVVFDLAIPGWLPATALFGDDDQHIAGVSYALFARARFLSASPDLDDALSAAASTSTSSTSVWNNLCSVVRLGPGRPRAVHAEKVPIQLTRYVSPPTRAYDAEEESSPPVFSRAAYAIQALPNSAPGEEASTNIPADILRGVQLHAIVPSRTSVDDDNVPLVLRLRSRSEDADTRNRLRVVGFEADIVQVEKYNTSPSSSYTARYPIPPAAQQPPVKPLKSTHPVGTLFELGLVSCPPSGRHVSRERSLVPSGASRLFRVKGAGSNENGVRFEEGWLRMEVGVPVSPGLQEDDRDENGKRVSVEGPFLNVRHEMRVKMTVGYDQPEGEELLSDELAFVVPLDFVRLAPVLVSPLASTFFHSSVEEHSTSTSSLPLPQPPMNSAAPAPSRARSIYALRSLSSLSLARSQSQSQSRPSTPAPPLPSPSPTPPPLPPLPAYSQLFHENGDRKDEWLSGGGALPLYREKEDTHASSMHSPSASTSSEASSSGTPDPDSPISPGMPLTPPGLALGARGANAKRARKLGFGESFLRFDEDEPEPAADEEDVAGCDADCEDEDGELEVDLGAEEVQYGIAF